MMRLIKEYKSITFNDENDVVKFLNNTQDEIVVTNIVCNHQQKYIVFYYKQLYK